MSVSPPEGDASIAEPLKELDLIRAVLLVARAGSFRNAARLSGLGYRTLEKRVRAFEKAAGVTLFHRQRMGLVQTEEGQRIIAEATRIDGTLRRLLRPGGATSDHRRRAITVSVTEGLATYWILPRLHQFEEAAPETKLVLRTDITTVPRQRLEADISIQYERPRHPDVTFTQLATLHVCLCGSRTYLNKHGNPTTAAELRKHKLVLIKNRNLDHRPVMEMLIGEKLADDRIATVESTTSLYVTIERGAGLGLVGTCNFAVGCDLIPVAFDLHASVPFYICVNREAMNDTAVVAALDWLKAIFDARTNPWFASEYVPETALASRIEELGLASDLDPYRFPV